MKSKRLSMQMRLTLLTTAITAIACVILTTGSILTIEQQFTAQKLIPATQTFPATSAPSSGDTSESAETVAPKIYATDESYAEADRALVRLKRSYNLQSLLTMAVIVAAASVLTYILVGRSMQPINKMVHTVEKMDENNLSVRLDDNAVYGELTTLAEAFNGMAERLETSFLYKKQFIANAAHELKTPLAALQTNVEVFELSQQHSEEDYTHLIQVIKRQTKRLIRLSEALLDINSDDTRNMQAYKLQDAIGDILGELKHAAAEKNLAVVAQLGETSIYGAPFLLNRLFTNLVDNAIKYSRAGGSINITATENADSVTVAVADSGAGIPLDEREKIFEPFYRIDKSRSRSIGGAGLGLAICKMAAEKHNATISIADNPNGGSIISVLFPKKH